MTNDLADYDMIHADEALLARAYVEREEKCTAFAETKAAIESERGLINEPQLNEMRTWSELGDKTP